MIGNLVGNYKITDKIGEGGMGSVFLGIDIMLEREVAIKMLRPELSRQPNVVERFRSEAVTLAKLNHPNIATLYSFLRQGDDYFMVMEYVRGETLDSMIRKSGAMRCDEAVALFCQALEGIEHAHKMGIIHRDIKPANMMLTEMRSIKVMDFGIARVLGSDRLTKTGHLIGTVEYMSPEQVRGEETDARSDIYSLGILLYEMLTGRVPFTSSSEYELMRSQIEDAPPPPRAFAPHIPLTVEQAIMRSLAKKREARYQSAIELRSILMQGPAGLVTTPLEAPSRGSIYAAPVTQIAEPPRPPSGEIVKETRLATDPGVASAASDSGLADSGLKATRLASPAEAYAPTASVNYATQSAPAAPASFLGKLNWKHYAGAGALLVALISVPLLLMGGGEKPETAKPSTPAVSQPAPPSASNPAPEVAQPAFAPPADAQSGGANTPEKAKTGGARDTGSRKSNQASTGAQAPAQNPDTRAASQKKAESQEAAKRDSNQKDNGKNKSMGEKVGGATDATVKAIKGIGGLFKKKKQ